MVCRHLLDNMCVTHEKQPRESYALRTPPRNPPDSCQQQLGSRHARSCTPLPPPIPRLSYKTTHATNNVESRSRASRTPTRGAQSAQHQTSPAESTAYMKVQAVFVESLRPCLMSTTALILSV